MADYLVEVRHKTAWQQPVKDKDLTSPPGSPAKGDRYIVGGSATGDWAGHDDEIAQYTGSIWEFLTSSEGWTCWVADEDKIYYFTGASWQELTSGGSGGNTNYEGAIDCSGNPNYPAADTGDYYSVSVAGKIGGSSGKSVVLDNFVICISTSVTGDEAAVGTNWRVIGGDMRKSVYDTDGDGIVDEAEAINDGVNYATAEDITDDIALGHVQNTDTKLDEGGANEISATQAKAAYTHSGGNGNDHSSVALNNTHRGTTSGNPHNVTKSDVGLSNVPNLDSTNAINKAHDQNTDTGTNQNNFNVGDGNDTDKSITMVNGDANPPKIRYNATTNKWQYTDDGTTWYDFGTSVGSGDMLKATYDTDADGIVDKAESVDDGAGNSSTAAQVKSAVTDSHTHSNKATLDSYTQSEVNLADAVSKKHSQNTDTGTNQNNFNVGDGADTDKSLTAINGDANPPKIRYNATTNTWQLSNNGVDFADIEAGTGSGDMLKSTYDTDSDGIVDKAESVDDGAGNSKSAADIKSHIDSTSNPHGVDKDDVGLSNVPNLNTTDAVNKAHDRSHALNSSSDHSSSIVENNLISADANGLPADSSIAKSGVSDAVSKKHSQNTDTGTSQNDFAVGDGADTTKTITAHNGDASEPKIRYNSSANAWQYTNDGTNWYNFGVSSGGAGSGDMTKATYDSDDDGIVDKAEALDDGTRSFTPLDLIKMQANIILNAFRLAIQNSLVYFNMVDGIVDEYEDESGVDLGSSSSISYNSSDDYYSNELEDELLLLLKCEGDDESTDVEDSTARHSPTCNGDAQIDTAQYKWGSSSLKFDGTGDYISIPDSNDWDIEGSSSESYTLDFWIRSDDSFSQVEEFLFLQWEDSDNNWTLYHNTSLGLVYSVYSNGSQKISMYEGSKTLNDTNWHHIALCIIGSDYGIYIDGVQKAYKSNSDVDTFTAPLKIGISGAGTYAFSGWLDEIRLVKGNPFNASPNSGKTDTITVPTVEYPLSLGNIVLVSQSFVAEFEPDDARMVILEEDVDSITLNTDLKAWASRDDGTNWEQGTLSDLGDFDSSKRILTAEFDLSEQDSDTDMCYKITGHNLKILKIHASALNWK